MPLVVENGSGVAGANTYADDAAFQAYALARGLTLPATQTEREVLLTFAMDYLETLRDRFKGRKTNPAQACQWPRECVVIDSGLGTYGGQPIPSDAIPAELIKAQCQLAYDQSQTDLLPTGDGRQVILEKVDVLETHYSDTKSTVIQPVFTKANAILKPLLINSSGFALSSVRV